MRTMSPLRPPPPVSLVLSPESSPHAAATSADTSSNGRVIRRNRICFPSFSGLFDRGRRAGGSVVDAGAVVGIEEVQAMGVEDEFDVVAGAGVRARVEPCEHGGAAAFDALLHLLERLLADIDGQLPNVLGDRGGSVHSEMDNHVGAECLAQL